MNKYPRTGEHPLTALWRRRKEQKHLVGNIEKKLRMCANKKSYDSRHNAEHAYQTTKFGNRAYKCPNCKQWHTTSKRKKDE